MPHKGPAAEPECLLQKMPCIICPSLSKFWKWSAAIIILLMFIFAMTLWGMAVSLSRYGTDLKDGRAELMGGIAKVHEEVKNHKQLTMENRVVTSEIRGILLEHRALEKDRQMGHR